MSKADMSKISPISGFPEFLPRTGSSSSSSST